MLIRLRQTNGDTAYWWTKTLTEGTYSYTAYCNDSASNQVQTETRTIHIDLTAPTWSNNNTNPATGVSYLPGQDYQFNITWNDNYYLHTIQFEHNFTTTLQNDSPSGNNSAEYYFNYTDLAVGTYVWRSYANDTATNLNMTDQWTYTVNKASHTVHLAFNGTESDASYIYPTQVNITGWLDISQKTENATLYRNGTNVSSDSPATEIITLAAGYYNYTYSYPESENYTAQSITRFLQINKSTTILTLGVIPEWTVRNQTSTNVTCSADNPEVNVTLYRNNSLVDSGINEVVFDYQTLAIGTYNYTCNTSGSQNYTSDSTWNTLTIEPKYTANCSLTFDPVSGQSYPVNLNVTCYCCHMAMYHL